jgi:hypothetical protein
LSVMRLTVATSKTVASVRKREAEGPYAIMVIASHARRERLQGAKRAWNPSVAAR